MNTKWQLATAAVTGSRHLRAARNGQDAACAWLGRDAAAIVVCDGCSAGASSEVGARLGARLVASALARRLDRGARAGDEATWRGVREEIAGAIAAVLDLTAPPCGGASREAHLALERVDGVAREDALRESFLFTIVAAAVTRDEVAVWALGDGAYATLGTSPRSLVMGPFADNAPPYLAYDLLGEPREAQLHVADARCGGVVIATDGVCDLIDAREGDAAGVLAPFAVAPLGRSEALRRHLALLARTGQTIDWDAHRIVNVPAALQDDCAVAALRWEVPS